MVCLQYIVLDFDHKNPKTFQHSFCILVAEFCPMFWMLWSGCWDPSYVLNDEFWLLCSVCLYFFWFVWLLCHHWLCFGCCLLSSYVLTVDFFPSRLWLVCSVCCGLALVFYLALFCLAVFCLACSVYLCSVSLSFGYCTVSSNAVFCLAMFWLVCSVLLLYVLTAVFCLAMFCLAMFWLLYCV
jgi:hypothetical protein